MRCIICWRRKCLAGRERWSFIRRWGGGIGNSRAVCSNNINEHFSRVVKMIGTGKRTCYWVCQRLRVGKILGRWRREFENVCGE